MGHIQREVYCYPCFLAAVVVFFSLCCSLFILQDHLFVCARLNIGETVVVRVGRIVRYFAAMCIVALVSELDKTKSI